KLAQKLKPVNVIISIEHKFNNIVISLYNKNDQKNKEFIDSVKFFNPIISNPSNDENGENEETEEEKEETASKSSIRERQVHEVILGGDRIYGKNGHERVTGSAGFWVLDNSNQSYLLTAGHGARVLSNRSRTVKFYSSSNTIIGPMHYYHSNITDFGLISYENPEIIPVPRIRNYEAALYPEIFIEDVLFMNTEGSHVCKSGEKTGTTCGELAAIDGVSTNSKGFILYGILKMRLFAAGGDSGGSVFHYVDLSHRYSFPYAYAVGILVRSNVIRGTSIVVPANVIMQYGIRFMEGVYF
ncbi:20187_t:CDS:2, partial [Racocetra persica]